MEAGALTALVEAVLEKAWRRDSSLHGDEHWRCVTATGLALAPTVGGADRTLVFCFGLLGDDRFAVLVEALARHSRGLVSDEPTTGTCWDADRLHLPRVSIQPRPDLFSTRAARATTALAAAGLLRDDGPPSWEALVTSVGNVPSAGADDHA
jgi:hypothetical protein